MKKIVLIILFASFFSTEVMDAEFWLSKSRLVQSGVELLGIKPLGAEFASGMGQEAKDVGNEFAKGCLEEVANSVNKESIDAFVDQLLFRIGIASCGIVVACSLTYYGTSILIKELKRSFLKKEAQAHSEKS